MTGKQKTIMMYFNFIALFGVIWSGWQLHRDIQALLFEAKGWGISRQTLGRFTFMIEINGNIVTVYNYLFIISLAVAIINIGFLIGFTMWNKRIK
jgi:hypothetical protein